MIYLASPFFNEKEINVKSIVKSKINDWGYRVHDPQNPSTNSCGWEKSNAEWGLETWVKDTAAIDACHFVIAIYWGLYSDTGTAWEIGYAFAKNYSMVVVVPDEVLTDKHSLMVANGCNNFIALSRFLTLNLTEIRELFDKEVKKYFLNGVVQT